MKTKIKNWLISIDDKTLIKIGNYIENFVILTGGIIIIILAIIIIIVCFQFSFRFFNY